MSRVYIGRLPNRANEKDVERFFKEYGRIREVVLKNGYGFVEFSSRRDAEDACYDMNGKSLCGDRVIVELAKSPNNSRRGFGGGRDRGGRDGRDGGRYRERSRNNYGPPTRTKYRLLVENLSSRVSWQDLKDLMRKVGEVTYADAHKARKNEGIVEFASNSDLRDAFDKFDGYDLYGRKLKLIRDDGDRSKSRSRSRSRHSRSRSRSKDNRSRSKSRSHSKRYRSRSGSRRSSREKSHGKSRSGSRDSKRSDKVGENGDKTMDDGSPIKERKSRSQSHNSRSRSRSRSHSRSDHGRSKSRSPSRSKSRSQSQSHHSNDFDNGDN